MILLFLILLLILLFFLLIMLLLLNKNLIPNYWITNYYKNIKFSKKKVDNCGLFLFNSFFILIIWLFYILVYINFL